MSEPRGRSTQRHATATDVARLAGVSQSAVSRAFTPGASIARETRARVEDAARALGYRPNAIARSLTTRRSRIIGVAAAYLQNHFYPDVLEALSKGLQARGYHLLLFTPDAARDADPLLQEVLAWQVDALILASTTLSSALAGQCRAAGIPVLLFNRTSRHADVSSVTGENLRGGRLIAEFLVAGGHKRLAFIAGIENSSTSRDREAGFTGWLAEHGHAPPLREVGLYDFEAASAAARRLLARSDRPDAIFVANDHMATAVSEVARHEFGLRIPRDLSLVGFDDTGPARWPSFSLTSFAQPLHPMVDAAVAMVCEMIEDPAAPTRHQVVPGELVVRGSARIPPEGCVSRGDALVWRPVQETVV
ncbi:LacI family transcriptional regulator [Falsiroseomonas bella]|uniref:LacI family transcriptional regulator n=1 Tax=Falsiroseomonas bella TaxID=2184016 RepID=A0A317FA04_9PROT|nr:LacI family DNA-binding transcriptional regulator [Falsiroseomonas bella]PWS35625.1 LacI family transcriptional regulator [Falsiroseomonas bella]